jgi:hypothetical protein
MNCLSKLVKKSFIWLQVFRTEIPTTPTVKTASDCNIVGSAHCAESGRPGVLYYIILYYIILYYIIMSYHIISYL